MEARHYKVGILGATGMVGQNYIRLLEGHPWFEVTYLAASPSSAGKTYAEAVDGRWHMSSEMPKGVRDLVVQDVNMVEKAVGQCDFVFSAFEVDKETVQKLEDAYADAGISVVSNASAHRHTADVPMLIPEINPDHLEMLEIQKKNHNREAFVAVKPNCSLQSYLTPIHALRAAGYPVDRMIITTLQATSGAGYPGVSSMDIVDNVVPYIGGEEEKSEKEPLKILGQIKDGVFVDDDSITIAAHCNRVPVVDGHLACVSFSFAEGTQKPSQDEILKIWDEFKGVPQELNLPFAPEKPIHYREEDNRPQPRKDRDMDKGMAVIVGRLRECPVLDYRFVGLSHNTVRGAAGGGILNAELLVEKGYL